MEKKSWHEFNKDLGWSTRIYIFMVLAILVLSFVFDAWNTNWGLTMSVALIGVLFMEAYVISFQRHPKIWKTIRWVLLIIIISLLLIGLTAI